MFSKRANKSVLAVTHTVICTTSVNTTVTRNSFNFPSKACAASRTFRTGYDLRIFSLRCFVACKKNKIVGNNLSVFTTKGTNKPCTDCPKTCDRYVYINTVNPSCLPTSCAGCNPKAGVLTPKKSCSISSGITTVILSAVPNKRCNCRRNASVTYPRIDKITTLNLSCTGGLKVGCGEDRFAGLLLDSIGSVSERLSERGTNVGLCSCHKGLKANLVST